MYGKKKKKAAMWLGLMIAFCTMFGQWTLYADAVTPSKTDYLVDVKGDYVFIGNKTAGSKEIGTEYYMTYTVKSVSAFTLEQQGLIGSVDVTQRAPFEKGGFIRWSCKEENSLFVEGATYFIKFTSEKGGFSYEITRAKDEAAEKVILDEYWGWPEGGFSHFGLWISGPLAAELTNVRCYDASGKDLGVMMTEGQGHVLEDVNMQKDTEVDHYYDVTVTDQYCVVLSNLRASTADKVYMEYTVESSEVKLSQEGIVLSNMPYAQYPYQDGVMRFDNYPEGSDSAALLEEGASYIICLERAEKGFDATIQKKINGEKTIFTFSNYLQLSPDENAKYYSLWFGDWSAFRVTFHLTNFKCYDGNKKNLGVQCNTTATIRHYGELEDYAGCEAAYYCQKTQNVFALYEDKTVKHTEDKVTSDGTYSISDHIMTAEFEDGTEKYDYLYQKITDKDKNEYLRLGNYTVNFVTGGETEIPAQELSNVSGYMVMRPDDPVAEGKEFEGWYTGEGKEFDFESIVTESMTLYAKYVGEDLPVTNSQAIPIVPVVIGGVLLLMIMAVVVVLLVKKGGKHAGNVEE